MALPKIEVPIFDLILPVSKKKINFRPFLVKEQKILLMANESGDKDTVLRSMKQVLSNCTLNEINIETLPIVDIEYYFLNLRARSVGEIVEMRYKCENQLEETVCNNNLDVSFNLLEIKLKETQPFDGLVVLTDSIGIKFKYPEYALFERIKEDVGVSEMALDVIVESIEYIYEGDKLYQAQETTKEELIEFLDSLNQEQFKNIENFFNNLPVLNKEIEIICSKCGYKHEIKLEGIESFFV